MMKTLQRIGEAFMIPVALLPVAGLLLGIGSSMQQSLLQTLPFLESSFWQAIALVLEQSGDIVFSNLPLIFAIGVAAGLSEDKGIAALAATVGFLIMNVVTGIFMPTTLPTQLYADVLGINTLQTSIFGGVIIGLVTAYLNHKYYDVKFPEFLFFFSGTRFVPIVTAVVAIFIGIIIAFIWPPIGKAIATFGELVATDGTNPLYLWIYGIAERAFLPFGLHRVFYFPLWYTEAGGMYTSIDTTVAIGDQAVWFKQLSDYSTYGYEALIGNVQAQGSILAGRFMQGKYPIMIFGLPAAAYAIYQEADQERKKIVSGLLLSAALTVALTGISEPLEFTFLFVAPLLFAIHAVLSGLSFMLTYLLNVHIGMSFSGGLIDLIIYGILPGNEFTNWIRVVLIGIVYAPVYYFLFRYSIRRFNLLTPGRKDMDNKIVLNQEHQKVLPSSNCEKIEAIIRSFGGAKNIKTIDACISRLRVSVNDISLVDQNQIKALGAVGIFISGNNVQAIYGTMAQQIKIEIQRLIVEENNKLDIIS